jgi:hypothetical protein
MRVALVLFVGYILRELQHKPETYQLKDIAYSPQWNVVLLRVLSRLLTLVLTDMKIPTIKVRITLKRKMNPANVNKFFIVIEI